MTDQETIHRIDQLLSAVQRLTVSVDRLSADLREYYLQDEAPPAPVSDISQAKGFLSLPCSIPDWATHLSVDTDGRAAVLDSEPVQNEAGNWNWNGARGKWLKDPIPDMAGQCIKVR